MSLITFGFWTATHWRYSANGLKTCTPSLTLQLVERKTKRINNKIRTGSPSVKISYIICANFLPALEHLAQLLKWPLTTECVSAHNSVKPFSFETLATASTKHSVLSTRTADTSTVNKYSSIEDGSSMDFAWIKIF